MTHTLPKKLIVLMVLLPVLVLAGLGWQLQQKASVEASVQASAWREAELKQLDQLMGQWLARLARSLERDLQTLINPLAATDLPDLSESIRPYLRSSSYVNGLYLAAMDGQRLFPPQALEAPAERAFLQRTQNLWRDLSAFKQTTLPAADEQYSLVSFTLRRPDSLPTTSGFQQGWRAWYAQTGMALIYWQRLSDGRFVALELNQIRLLSDLINLLPDQHNMNLASGALIRLLDERDSVIHQWGDATLQMTSPQTSLHLSHPFGSWRLEYYTPAQALIPAQTFGWVMSLSAVALVLIGLGAYLYREQQRDWVLAQQRVNFVNQVSHELKTPMTNIRLYAELLEAKMEDEDEKARSYLQVITDESERLSRLIENVLSFSRQQNGKLALKAQALDLGELIQRIANRFNSLLAQQGLSLSLELAPVPVLQGDPVAIDQIVSNLLSNAEKYARTGTRVTLKLGLVTNRTSSPESGRSEPVFCIQVLDDGEGIQLSDQSVIFDPFVRLKNALNEGVSGTGIGLHIARELARQHGGDLKVLPSSSGAQFELTLTHLATGTTT